MRRQLLWLVLSVGALLAAGPMATGSAGAATVTSVALTASANPINTGEQVTYTAVVTPVPDGGTITFSGVGGTTGGCKVVNVSTSTGAGTCQLSYKSTDLDLVSARYSGDTNFAASQSANLEELVNQGTSTIVSSSANPASTGKQVTYTATVTPAPDGGTVSFADGGAAISGCTAIAVSASSGKASCQQTYGATGTHAITGAYSGDTSFGASQSPALSEAVGALTTIKAAPNPSNAGKQVTYTATVAPNPGGGTVAFADAGAAISGCTAVAVSATTGTATCEQTYPTAGSHSIAASFSGFNGSPASQSGTLEEVIGLPGTSTTLTVSEGTTASGKLTYTATVTPDPHGGTVAFTSEGKAISGCSAVTVSASSAKASCQQAPSSGAQKIAASYSGDTSFAPSTSEELSVKVGTQTLAPTNTRITQFKTSKNTVTASFSAEGATGYECALIGPAGKGQKRAKASFHACKSPQSYGDLKAGTYELVVRGESKAGVDKTPASKKFKIG